MSSFMDTLRLLGDAAFDELTDEERNLVAEVRDTQDVGELTLTIRYAARNSDQLRVSYEVKAKRPKRKRDERLAWFGEEVGTFERENPRQRTLDIDPDAPRRVTNAEIRDEFAQDFARDFGPDDDVDAVAE